MGFYHFTQEVSHAQPFLHYLLIFARVQFCFQNDPLSENRMGAFRSPP